MRGAARASALKLQPIAVSIAMVETSRVDWLSLGIAAGRGRGW